MSEARRIAATIMFGLGAACGSGENAREVTPAGTPAKATDSQPTLPSATSDASPSPTVPVAPDDALTDNPNAAQNTSNGKIVWTVSENEAEALDGTPLQYASFYVPLDYAEPSGTQIQLFVTRFEPAAGIESSGVLMFNPGGPGQSVAAFAPSFAKDFRDLFPSMDIVLIDNRGTGFSTPIECFARGDVRFSAGSAEPATVREGLQFVGQNTQQMKDACLERFGDSLRYFNTENVARDMEAVRQALDVQKLNYWGVSYGAMQGALYAKLFPDHVGAFVLDSPSVRTLDGSDWVDSLYGRAQAFEEQLARFFEWADGDATSPLFGNEVASLELYDALVAEVEAGVTFNEQTVPPEIWSDLSDALLMYGEWDALAQAIADAQADDWGTAAAIADAAIPPQDDSIEATLAFQQSQQNYVLNLLDSGCNEGFSLDDAVERYTQIVTDSPRMGPRFAPLIARCLSWDINPAEPRLVANDLQSPPLLVMSGLHDPATPHANAVALVEQFDNGSKLLSSNSEGHGVGTRTACERDALTAFMLSGDASAAPELCVNPSAPLLLSVHTLPKQVPGLPWRLPRLPRR